MVHLLSHLVQPILAAPAAPASAHDVEARLAELYSSDASVRLAAANALARTPPELVAALAPTELPCWSGVLDLESSGCRYHNHALYHLVRVLGSLARQSLDLATPYGRACVATRRRTCPALEALRSMVDNPSTGFVAREVEEELPPGSPPDVGATALEGAARTALEQALAIVPTDTEGWQAWGALQVGRAGARWWVLPRCAGTGMHAICRWYGRVERDGRVDQHLLATPVLAPDLVPQSVHLTPDGALGVLLNDGGCCGDPRLALTVFDLRAGQRPVCEITCPHAEQVSADQRAALITGLKVEDGICVPPATAGATVRPLP
jgi:hypothetical protein